MQTDWEQLFYYEIGELQQTVHLRLSNMRFFLFINTLVNAAFFICICSLFATHFMIKEVFLFFLQFAACLDICHVFSWFAQFLCLQPVKIFVCVKKLGFDQCLKPPLIFIRKNFHQM